MTFDEFMAALRKEVEQFEKEWREKNEKYPLGYPMQLDEDGWYDQFITHMQSWDG